MEQTADKKRQLAPQAGLLTLTGIQRKYGGSYSTAYRRTRVKGKNPFPKPVVTPLSATRHWIEDEVDEWFNNLERVES